MSGFNQLLNATIAHLEGLQARGVRHVPVTAALVECLTVRPALQNPSTASRSASPAPASSSGRAASPVAAPSVSTSTPSSGPVPKHLSARWNPANLPKSTAAPGPTPAPAARPLPPELDPAAKSAAMDDLRRRALACVRCPNLASSRKSVVFGVGDIHARLMFVGEAPGADEDTQGEPFVGKAGELLTRIITAMDLSRSTVFIANILKCRPDTPGQTAGNRKPTTEEMSTCIPWLHEQIDLIQPDVMVALGATAVEGLLGKTVGITRLRGQWQQYRGIPLMPTYHPAYLLRNQAPAEKRKVWEDMLAVMERLKLPISEKQRGYFLTK